MSPLSVHRAAAAAWVDAHGTHGIADALSCLPGLSFLLLSRSVDDAALTLMARDALWKALGED